MEMKSDISFVFYVYIFF